eukprot:gb/GFBE01047495.1/.p1 GENE.gb/GFBE01047495.1/~~gb/GFBE01047495.1/.p1  ORF type:complete len:219 (+),score=47.91 gb/GFBE01047495.1/:1-657(+)
MALRLGSRRLHGRLPAALVALAALCMAAAAVECLAFAAPITRSVVSKVRLAAMPTAEAARSTFDGLFSSDQRPVVLYDGVCNMCNRAVDVALEKDPDGRQLRFSALQSEVGRQLLVFCGRRAEDLSSMLVVKPDGTCLVQSDAVLFVGQQLDGSPLLKGASKVAEALVPKALRNVVYDTVAENRYRVLGRREKLRKSEDGLNDRFIDDARAASPAVER